MSSPREDGRTGVNHIIHDGHIFGICLGIPEGLEGLDLQPLPEISECYLLPEARGDALTLGYQGAIGIELLISLGPYDVAFEMIVLDTPFPETLT